MNRMNVMLTSCLVAVSALAESEIAVDVRMPQLKPVKHEIVLKRLGGFIINEKSGSGTFAFVNAQKETGLEPLNAAAERIRADLMIRTAVCAAERPACGQVGELLKKVNAEAGVIVVNDASLPTLLVAPEDRWGFVNVAGLSAGGVTKEVLETRLRREVIRAFGYVGGGRPTRSFGCVMNPVRKPADLDRLSGDAISMEAVPDMLNYLEKVGIKPFRKASYAAACKEGWAPQPTNDYQKAIWNQVREPPKNPMKIEFDPKKGR